MLLGAIIRRDDKCAPCFVTRHGLDMPERLLAQRGYGRLSDGLRRGDPSQNSSQRSIRRYAGVKSRT